MFACTLLDPMLTIIDVVLWHSPESKWYYMITLLNLLKHPLTANKLISGHSICLTLTKFMECIYIYIYIHIYMCNASNATEMTKWKVWDKEQLQLLIALLSNNLLCLSEISILLLEYDTTDLSRRVYVTTQIQNACLREPVRVLTC